MVTGYEDDGARLRPEPTAEELAKRLARIEQLHAARVKRVMQMGSHPPMRPAWGENA